MVEHDKNRSKRLAQHRLAWLVVELVHGRESALVVQEQHSLLFQPGSRLSVAAVVNLAEQGPAIQAQNTASPSGSPAMSAVVRLPLSLVRDQTLGKILFYAGLAESKGHGQRLVNAGGAYFGRQSDSGEVSQAYVSFAAAKDWRGGDWQDCLINRDLLLVRAGKQKVRIIQILQDAEFTARGLSCPGWTGQTP